MDSEKPFDESRVPEGVEKFNKEQPDDDFLNFEERTRVWEMVADDLGSQWNTMDRDDREKVIERYTNNIIKEVKTMAGGIWEHLSPIQKRELFHARFIDANVVPAERQDAFKGKQKVQESFPDMDNWFLTNRNLMFGMMRTEREVAYRTARGKWEKEHKK